LGEIAHNTKTVSLAVNIAVAAICGTAKPGIGVTSAATK
jgi:hypothetical protein